MKNQDVDGFRCAAHTLQLAVLDANETTISRQTHQLSKKGNENFEKSDIHDFVTQGEEKESHIRL